MVLRDVGPGAKEKVEAIAIVMQVGSRRASPLFHSNRFSKMNEFALPRSLLLFLHSYKRNFARKQDSHANLTSFYISINSFFVLVPATLGLSLEMRNTNHKYIFFFTKLPVCIKFMNNPNFFCQTMGEASVCENLRVSDDK